MAPAQANIDVREQPQLKMRLPTNSDENHVKDCDNNNTVKTNKPSEDICSEIDFDLAKYEAMDFKPQIRWPDLIVQVLLHLVTLYGMYLIITNNVKIYTILFGK